MAKTTVIQKMKVQMQDGTTQVACCGPAALTMLVAGATGYTKMGEPVEGKCCHIGIFAEEDAPADERTWK
jgi:hypothetical protein